MRTRILGLLAVALLAAPVAAQASYVYTFGYETGSSAGSFSLTVPSIVTPTSDLGVYPLSVGSYTYTQAKVFDVGFGLLCFWFATDGVSYNACGSPSVFPTGGAVTYASFSNCSVVGDCVFVGKNATWPYGYDVPVLIDKLNIAETSGPEPVPLPAAAWMLLSGLGGLGLLRRRNAN